MRPSHSVFLHSNGDTLEVYKSATGALIASCNRPMAPMVRFWYRHMCSIFDYRKAFDSLTHKPLIEKLKATNINPYLLRWITAYTSVA